MLKTHTEYDVQVAVDGHTHEFDSHPTSLICTLRHVGKTPSRDLRGGLRTVRDVHGLWEHPMPAARFT